MIFLFALGNPCLCKLKWKPVVSVISSLAMIWFLCWRRNGQQVCPSRDPRPAGERGQLGFKTQSTSAKALNLVQAQL